MSNCPSLLCTPLETNLFARCGKTLHIPLNVEDLVKRGALGSADIAWLEGSFLRSWFISGNTLILASFCLCNGERQSV